MEQLNRIDVETRSGGRTFELLCGDVVDLAGPIDLLVISAQGRSYYPTPTSVIGALSTRLGIDVGQLAERPERDFRHALNCWVSRRLSGTSFRRLLCVEIADTQAPERAIRQLFSNVFATVAALEAVEYKLQTIAMPLLATGRGRFAPELVMQPMLDYALKALERSSALRTIQFVVRDEDQALQLSEAMDKVLGRAQVVMPQGAAIQLVRRKIASRITTAAILAGDAHKPVFDELRKAILSPESRPFVLGVAARKVIEFIIHDLMAGKKYKDVHAALQQLIAQHDQGPALWIVHYMEVIRTLGNNAAHSSVKHQRQPAHPTPADLELLLLCLLRVLDFWIERKRTPTSQASLFDQEATALVDDLPVT